VKGLVEHYDSKIEEL